MSLPRYPTYKDSGVEWLGEVPGHWGVRKLLDLARIESGHTPSRQHDEYWVESECVIPWFTLADVSYLRDLRNVYIRTTSQKISPLGMENSAARLLPPGTVLLSRTASVGFSGITEIELAVSQDFAAWICGPDLRSIFLLSCLRAMKGEFSRLMMGSTHQTIYMPDIMAFRVPLPPLDEQTHIAAFLDRETAKIDALVAEQERLIELLKEKRQAVISHAVTKGLNPDAPMKDSGVEWLGEVPAHWATPSLNARYVTELGKMLDEKRVSGRLLVPYLRNVDVQWDAINLANLPEMDISEAEYDRYTVRPGDVLVCEGGEVGRAAIVDSVDGVIGFQKALHRLRARSSDEHARYLFYTFVWAALTGVFQTGGTSTIAHLTGEQLRRYRFPRPPVSEQVSIAAFLDAATARLDLLTHEAQRAIDLLQERRTALISAAVTGQIDVRPAAERASA